MHRALRKVEAGELWRLRGLFDIPDQYFLVLQVYREDGMYVGTQSMKLPCGTVCNVMVNGDPMLWEKEA